MDGRSPARARDVFLLCRIMCATIFLEVLPMKKEKRIFPPSVRVYFTGRNKSLDKKLEVLAKKHSMSSSTIGALAIRLGLPQVEKNLEGLIQQMDIEQTSHQ